MARTALTVTVIAVVLTGAGIAALEWNRTLWRELVFGEGSGQPASPWSGVLPPVPADVAVVVQEHDLTGVCSRSAADCERYRAGYDGRREDIRDVLERVSINVFGRAWTGELRYEAAPEQTVGRLTVVVDGTDPGVCATAYKGSRAGLITLGFGCAAMGLDQRTAFRAVFAHEIGHALGFHHSSIPGGLMNPTLHMGNLPTEERPAVREEVAVARCAFRLTAVFHPILIEEHPGDVVPAPCIDIYAAPVPALSAGAALLLAATLTFVGIRRRRKGQG